MMLHVLIAMVAGWIQYHQQRVITYLCEENRVIKAQLGGRRLRLTETERRRLARLAHSLGRQRLREVATLATPETLLRWYHRLMAQKFDGSWHRRPLGRPRVTEEIEQLVVQMAEENTTWDYRRIQGALANLGHSIDAITVRNILRRHHMEPAPQRRKSGRSWTQFLQRHWEVLAATDFFTVEVATWHGLVTYYVLVIMELATRRAQIAGITRHPTTAFMQQCARQLTDPFDGFLLGKRYLLHDRDTKFTQAFDELLKDSGVEPIVLPPRSPNLNARCERFVRSIKEEALDQTLILGERSLSYVIQQYLVHYHTERNHQGLDNRLIAPTSEPHHHVVRARVHVLPLARLVVAHQQVAQPVGGRRRPQAIHQAQVRPRDDHFRQTPGPGHTRDMRERALEDVHTSPQVHELSQGAVRACPRRLRGQGPRL
jgi:putative transposase